MTDAPPSQVEDLLLGDPENAELSEMYSSLSEVIQLTEDLLKDAREQLASASVAAAGTGPSSSGICMVP